ncbi:MAG: NUDIX domain [Roseibaca calidilacus]|jgi:8-oxo-dGTP pyrophosphatase MutT (NUDIX family)|uniref:NUDIX domain n=1 Tax=Roseibaca calidilacus TaxID=1666912 RepID=A0A0P7YU98_9RHOB|nr:NUDIX domain-containing protein [Roseibaca calidilacus]KPP94023.1 MAG: NUDIX domain [Roseibaca calidilacus]CUX79432.1 NUDIX domain-containing protein [Roseibaca calidilacus]
MISTVYRSFHIPDAELTAGAIPFDVAEYLEKLGLLRAKADGARLELCARAPLSDRLEDVRAALHKTGMIGPARGELMALRLVPEGPELAVIDRSAVRILGLWVHKVHVNGLVQGSGPPQVWLSRRAAHAEWNANRFDTLVAGGCAAGHGIEQTVRLESWQEAGLTSAQLADLKPVSRMSVQYPSERGFLREVLIIFDLDLPGNFTPECHDGEIDWAKRVSLDEMHHLLLDGTEMKMSSALVCRDLLRRLGKT